MPPVTSRTDQNGSNVRGSRDAHRKAQAVVSQMDSTATFTPTSRGEIAGSTWIRVLVEAPKRVVAHWGEIVR
jgi:hypothetical protein